MKQKEVKRIPHVELPLTVIAIPGKTTEDQTCILVDRQLPVTPGKWVHASLQKKEKIRVPYPRQRPSE